MVISLDTPGIRFTCTSIYLPDDALTVRNIHIEKILMFFYCETKYQVYPNGLSIYNGSLPSIIRVNQLLSFYGLWE